MLKLAKRKKQKGYAFIEVMMALLVASFGMLGAASVLLMGGRSATSSYAMQTGGQLAAEMADRMRANIAQAKLNSYTIAMGASVSMGANCGTVSCSPSDLAVYDKAQWLASLRSKLPAGRGSVTTATSGNNLTVTIVVEWDDNAASKRFQETESTSKFTLETVM